MSRKYKYLDPTGMHYMTATLVGWVDIFSRKRYRDILIDSLKWCQKHKGLHICAYVIMTNHLHLIAYTEDIPVGEVMASFKKHTSGEIFQSILQEPESRREWLVRLLKWYGKQRGQRYQIWQHESHPVGLWSRKVIRQKISYLHNNPVRSGFVSFPPDWRYSSAGTYAGKGEPQELDVEIVDAWGLG